MISRVKIIFMGFKDMVCICLSITETIFVNEILVDLSSIIFSARLNMAHSYTYALVLAAMINEFTMEGSFLSVVRSL